MVLADVEDRAARIGKAWLPRRRTCAGFSADVEARHSSIEGCALGWQRALEEFWSELDDLVLCRSRRYDCFTIAELIEYEARGLTPRR